MKNIWICLNCDTRLQPNEVTNDEKCTHCGETVYTEDDLRNAFNKYCGFRTRHDLYNIWEELKNVKENPKRKTAQGDLWIDELIARIKILEESFETLPQH